MGPIRMGVRLDFDPENGPSEDPQKTKKLGVLRVGPIRRGVRLGFDPETPHLGPTFHRAFFHKKQVSACSRGNLYSRENRAFYTFLIFFWCTAYGSYKEGDKK